LSKPTQECSLDPSLQQQKQFLEWKKKFHLCFLSSSKQSSVHETEAAALSRFPTTSRSRGEFCRYFETNEKFQQHIDNDLDQQMKKQL
jgi:hypothetical protein